MIDRHELLTLVYDLAYEQPQLVAPVRKLLGTDDITGGIHRADEPTIEAVAGVVTAVNEAWAATNDLRLEESPAVLREVVRLRAQAEAKRIVATEAAGIDDERPGWADLIVSGKDWLLSGPDKPQPLWGNETTILAALDQPTTIAGPQGAGKTVFGGRLALGYLGIVDTILGLPVTPGAGNVLYLAGDRPDQARLSLRRMIDDSHLDTLEARLRVWKGPPPEDVARQPLTLLKMAEVAEAGFLIIDSVKDVALKLSSDEVAAAYNTALQHCVTAGVQVTSLHHPRKLGGDTRGEAVVRDLDDLYGGTWITTGNGSVLYLQPGDLDGFTLRQIKTPNGSYAEIAYEHIIETGDVRQATTPTLADILDEAGQDGITAIHAARCLYRLATPEDAKRKRVARALNEMAEEGTVIAFTGPDKRKRWKAAE